MIRINLLPVRAAQKKEKLRSQIVVALGCLVLVVLGCTAAYMHITMQLADEKAQVEQKQQQIAALRKQIGQVGRFKKLQQELRGKLEVLDKLKQGRTGPAQYLDELNKIMPEKLWLVSFSESAGHIVIQGTALNEKIVAEFMRNLNNSSFFNDMNLVQTEQAVSSGMKLQKFQLTFTVTLPKKQVS